MSRIWLRNIRKAENLTQKQAAERCGISRTHWASLEQGERDPSMKTAIKISKSFNFHFSRFYDDIISKLDA